MSQPSAVTRFLARICESCPVCRKARRDQKGWAYQLVRRVESHVCPACHAYEKVHGRKAYEPVPCAPATDKLSPE